MIDTTNKRIVAVQGDVLVIMNPKQRLTKDEALNLAAYLVALSGVSLEEFRQVYEAVCNA